MFRKAQYVNTRTDSSPSLSILPDDYHILCTNVGTVNITMPDPTLFKGRILIISMAFNSTGQYVLVGGVNPIKNNPQSISAKTSAMLICDGLNWYNISGF